MNETTDLRLLQALRLRGRSDASRVAESYGEDEAATADHLNRLAAQALVDEKNGTFVLSKAGESLRARLIASERSQLDDSSLQALYADFSCVDPAFKRLVADVQLGQIERADAAQHLAPIHQQLQPLLDRASALIPRLSLYASRFQDALQALQGGDGRYLASPLVESYHSIWFEWHEELIQASGRTRAQESSKAEGG